jgi:methylmalonyl-CoA/ethylmalonyl-CoA epimerase
MNGAFGQVMQHGYVVHDVDEVAREWAGRVGAGPFYVFDRMVMEQSFRGKRVEVETRLAFGYWGSIQIELIQPLNDVETLYSQGLRDAPGMLHHMATIVPDLSSLLVNQGLEDHVMQSGTMPTGVKFAYLNEYLPGKCHLELIQAPESALAGFAAMQAMSQHWNGDRPVRSMADLGADMAALA